MPLFRPGSTSAQKPSLSPRRFPGAAAPFHPGRAAAATPGGAPAIVGAADEESIDAGASPEVHAEVAAPNVELITPEVPAASDANVESFQVQPPVPESVLDTASLTDGVTSGWGREEAPEELNDASMELEVDADPIEMVSPLAIESDEREQATELAATDEIEPAARMETEITLESADEASFTWEEPVQEVHADAVDDAAPEWALAQATAEVDTPQVDGSDVTQVAVEAIAPMAGDFQSLVLEADGRERTLEVLDAVARRVRAGEITVSADAGSSAESVLASLLASLLSTKP